MIPLMHVLVFQLNHDATSEPVKNAYIKFCLSCHTDNNSYPSA